MLEFPSYQLSFQQKFKLAISVFCIYWPLRVYINVEVLSWKMAGFSLLLWIVEFVVTILFFIFWLSITELLQKTVFLKVKSDYIVDLKILVQLAILAVAGGLALIFNFGFHQLWHYIEGLVNPQGIRDFFSRHTAGQHLTGRQDHYGHGPAGFDQRSKADNALTIMAMLSLFYLAANRRGYKRLEFLNIHTEQLKRTATQAQLIALKNQVNPHFLFNSLSILSSLVEVNPELSVRFIDQLSKAFRYILEQRETELVTLKTELEFLETYIFLLNIRFEGKLKIRNEVSSSDSNQWRIAPLTLQLLIENAVKHNQMSIEKPLAIHLTIKGEYLVIENTINLRPVKAESTGLGLTNILERYLLLSPNLILINDSDGLFSVHIPLLP